MGAFSPHWSLELPVHMTAMGFGPPQYDVSGSRNIDNPTPPHFPISTHKAIYRYHLGRAVYDARRPGEVASKHRNLERSELQCFRSHQMAHFRPTRSHGPTNALHLRGPTSRETLTRNLKTRHFATSRTSKWAIFGFRCALEIPSQMADMGPGPPTATTKCRAESRHCATSTPKHGPNFAQKGDL